MSDFEVVEVTWHDSSLSSGWFTKEELKDYLAINKAFISRTVGWLVKKTRGSVVVAMSRSNQDTFADIQDIPMKMVLTVRTLGKE